MGRTNRKTTATGKRTKSPVDKVWEKAARALDKRIAYLLQSQERQRKTKGTQVFKKGKNP